MTETQWLYRAWNLETEIKQIQDTYNRELTKMTDGTTEITGMAVAGSKDYHKAMDRMADLSAQIAALKAHRLGIINEVMEVIETAPNANLRMLLRFRFISSMPWSQITKEMHYSEIHMKRLYKKALEAVRPAVDEKINMILQ